MKRIVGTALSFLLVSSFLCISAAFSGEPYAPVYKFTAEDFNKKFGKMGMPMEDAEMAGTKSLEGILNHGKYTDMVPQAQTIVLVFFKGN